MGCAMTTVASASTSSGGDSAPAYSPNGARILILFFPSAFALTAAPRRLFGFTACCPPPHVIIPVMRTSPDANASTIFVTVCHLLMTSILLEVLPHKPDAGPHVRLCRAVFE